jgi:hypothetical protein
MDATKMASSPPALSSSGGEGEDHLALSVVKL